ncbi:MAG: hypothetical protein LBF38_02800 [Deltaproteobacteria bacterium]|jgi:hypothetical protein|nr:hypothetical protein [Deltaproteobacteria bacterium]
MNKEQELPLRLARELCQRFIERRILSVAKLPEALALLGRGAEALLKENASSRVLAMAGDLTIRLVERGRLGTPAAALANLESLCRDLAEVWAKLPPGAAELATKSSVELVLKLLETNAAGLEPLPETLLRLAQVSADLLPQLPVVSAPKAKKK